MLYNLVAMLMRAANTQRAGNAMEKMNENTKGTQVTKVSERRASSLYRCVPVYYAVCKHAHTQRRNLLCE